VNFLANLSNLGVKTFFVSALPDNKLGLSALKQLDKFRINHRYVQLLKKGRMGIYFVEHGVGTRPSYVIYDRKNSTVNYFDFSDYNFIETFKKCNHYHLSGITPALSKNMMITSVRSVRLAKELGLEVSCDLNYRSSLWKYHINQKRVDPENVISEICSYCDYLTGNASDIQKIFNIEFENNFNNDNIVYYQNLLLQISKRFPHIKIIAVTIHKSVGTYENYIGSCAYKRETNQFFFSPNKNNIYKPFLIDTIVDRIGSEDAFSSGFIYGLKKYNKIQNALDFGLACSVLKHSYLGDFNHASVNEIKSFLKGDHPKKIIH
jgi:2-dehydro-3-deoxygluconokinase